MSHLLLLLLPLLPTFTSAIRTVVAKNQTSVLVQEGGQVRLSCRTEEQQWFFCLWHSPTEDKQCAIQYDQPASVCRENNRTSLIGGSHFCDIRIKVEREDHGEWMCLVNDNQQFDAVKQFVFLEVGVIADMGIAITDGGEEYREGPSFLPSFQGVLTITEGDVARLDCWANEGYPRPRIVWSGPDWEEGSFSRSVWNVSKAISTEATGHTYSSSQAAIYTANLTHDNTSISCLVVQGEFSRRMSLLLHVQERVYPVALTEGATLLPSLLLLLIFLILSCVLLTILIIRGRSKRRRRDKQLSNEESPRSPLVTEQFYFQQKEDLTRSGNSGCHPTLATTLNYHEYQNQMPDLGCGQLPSSLPPLPSPPQFRRSLSVSDLSSIGSVDQVTVMDSTFAAISAIPSPALVKHQKYLDTAGSVPHLDTRRRSSTTAPGRVLINPTSKCQQASQACHPLSAKSMGQLPARTDSQRRRRQTEPSHSKSSHSVFDCEEGCFEMDQELDRSQQTVTITTGPLII